MEGRFDETPHRSLLTFFIMYSLKIPDMALIPEGFFLMGSETGMDNERPVHRIWLDAYMIGKFPLTNREFRGFVAEKGEAEPPFWSEEMFCHPDKPVVGISWTNAMVYCDWLSRSQKNRVRRLDLAMGSRKKNRTKRKTKIGAVYCRTMALAAVVSLLAQTKKLMAAV